MVSSPDIYKTIFFTGNYWMKSALSLQPNPLYFILTHIWVWQMWHRNISGPRESVELNGGRKRALFLWLGTNWRVMPSRSWLLLQPQVEWVTWRPCLYIFSLESLLSWAVGPFLLNLIDLLVTCYLVRISIFLYLDIFKKLSLFPIVHLDMPMDI